MQIFVDLYIFTKNKFVLVKISVSKYTLSSFLLVVAVVVVSSLLEMILPLATDIFRFPMNIILMAIWLFVVVEIYRRRDRSIIARYLLSQQATILSIAALAVGCVVMGLQRVPATRSYMFVIMLFFALTQLTMVTLRGWRGSRSVRWLFLCCHLGLLLVLLSGVWGSPDTDVLRMKVTAQPSNMVFYEDGRRGAVDYTLSLSNIEVDYYSNGTPSSYRADIMVDDNPVTLKVNYPYRVKRTEHIYLTSVDNSGCIVQIVRQPWLGVTLTGIVLLIIGAVLMFFRGPRV